MPGLDALLRQAADGGTSRARPAEFDLLVRRARDRRRNWSVAGAAGLVACVAVGVAAVAGLRAGPTPVPLPAASVAVPDNVVRPVDLNAAVQDPVLGPLITDIAVLAWTPDPGRTVDEVRDGPVYESFLEGNDITAGEQPLLNDVADLRATFPAAEVGGPAIVTADPLTMSSLEKAAVRLRDVPGVRDAKVTVLRGMWFRAMVEVEAAAGREDQTPGRVIGMPGIQGGECRNSPGSGGRVHYTSSVVYVGGGVDRAGLAQIRTALAEPWNASGDAVSLTGKIIEPG